MWQHCKRFFAFQGKALEIRYNTWKTHREIARAYREQAPLAAVFRFAGSHARLLLLAAAVVIAGGLLYVAAPPVLRVLATAAKSVKHALASAPKPAPAQKPESVEKVRDVSKPETAPAVAPQIAPVKTAPEPLPASGSEPFSESMLYCIVANKATKTLYFIGRNREGEAWRIVDRCPAVMGRNEGQKQAAGDRRTPEGEYFVIGRKDGWELNPIYGPLAYVLNYPNEEDRKAGRTGQGIWIHGMPEDSSRMVTRGCIVLDNNNLLALSQHLRLGIGTPVIIIDKKEVADPAQYPDYAQLEQKRKTILNEYRQRERDFADLLVRWKKAWETKNIDEYARYYDQAGFSGGGLSWPGWREKKLRTFEIYDTIGISLDKIRVVDFSESTAVVVFLQLYATAESRRQNAKKLSLIRSGSRWLITREETFSNEEFFL
jgi:murein L,D-transpeptidase YafK